MMAIDELEHLLVEKRRTARAEIFGNNTVLSHAGFTDTTEGPVLTS